MRTDKGLEQFLNTYEISQPGEKQIAMCVDFVKKKLQKKKVRRTSSYCFLVETQMRYMKGEIVVSFMVSLLAMVLLQFTNFFLSQNYFMEITVGIAPFWIVPIILSLMKSRKQGMLELEASSKFSIPKVIAVRVIVNQALAIFMIFSIWLLSSASLESFAWNRLFFAFISFEVASVCFLWFGKVSTRNGLFSVLMWSVVMMTLLVQEEMIIFMQMVNSMALFLITLILMGVSWMVLYRYIKSISFEREDERWNLSWIE